MLKRFHAALLEQRGHTQPEPTQTTHEDGWKKTDAAELTVRIAEEK